MMPSRTHIPEGSIGTAEGRFVSLRTKFGVFLSLIIVITCSALTFYFIQNKRESMTQHLKDVGRILTKHLAYNPRVRFAIATEDQETLAEFMDGVMAVDDVVYVIISGPDGEPLLARTKGIQSPAGDQQRSLLEPLYPDPAVRADLVRIPRDEPTLTSLTVTRGQSVAVRTQSGSRPFFPDAIDEERLYDFALPVTRPADREGSPITGFEHREPSDVSALGASSGPKVFGLIQIGLTESNLNHALVETVRTSAWLTLFIILAGIAGTVLLTGRIITPLRSLAGVARRVTEGDLTANVEPTTHDEIGQLTWLFNNMTQSLKERDSAITDNLSTISDQVRQLTTLSQASTAIASTLDLDRLLATVLQLLTDNLGFVRTIVTFYDADRGLARTARVSGVPDDIARAAAQLEFPVTDDGGLHAEVLLRGKPLLVVDLHAVAHRLPPQNLELMRQVGITSFVAAPLRSTQRVLGYIGADKGAVPCKQEDLDVLSTMASHVAVAIDNARAYFELGELTTGLERRVHERTEEIQAANARLTELDKLKSAFVSIVSHELRTPMTAIRGYVDNMLDGLAGSLTDKQRHYLNRVKVNADRLTHMISELLDLSRIEAGRVELAVSEIDLGALAADVVDEFQRSASERGILLDIQAPSTIPAIRGDRNKLHQVLTNLVGNAMKFTTSGGRIGIDFTLVDASSLQVTVSDSGCGIPADELPRIFERFFRGSAVPPEARGAGLGLAIVRTLVELHKGRIWVESTIGRGSQFCFILPVGANASESSSQT